MYTGPNIENRVLTRLVANGIFFVLHGYYAPEGLPKIGVTSSVSRIVKYPMCPPLLQEDKKSDIDMNKVRT